MPTTVIVPNGIITMAITDFDCPKCTCPHDESDYYEKMRKSTNGFIYISCKGCKRKIGITTDIRGDTRVWMKEDEKNNQFI
jgi:transposase-like protein